MNYIENINQHCCTSINPPVQIRVRRVPALMDTITGEIKTAADIYDGPELGRTFTSVNAWAVENGYFTIGLYHLESSALEAYREIVDSLNDSKNGVIKIANDDTDLIY